MKIVNIKKLIIVASTLLVLFSTFSLAAKHKSKNQELVENNSNSKESVLSALMGSDDKNDNPPLKKEVPNPLLTPLTASPMKRANPVKKANPIAKLNILSKPSKTSLKKAPTKKNPTKKNPAGKKLAGKILKGKKKRGPAAKKAKARRNKKKQTMITSMFSVHRDQLPSGAFDRLNKV